MGRFFNVILFAFSFFILTTNAQVSPGAVNAIPVEFRFNHTLAATDSGVGLNGSFNNWLNGIFKMRQYQPNWWKVRLELLPLTYEYKIVTYTDTVGQSGVTGYYTDPLNPIVGGPFTNSFMKVRDPMIYYLLPKTATSTQNERPTITANISWANNSGLKISRTVFTIDDVEIPNAASYIDTVNRIFSYTPPLGLSYKLHKAYLKIFNNAGDSAEAVTEFTVSSFFSVAPFTFLFDAKSPNFRFQSTVNRVDLKGDFNSGGNSPMTDPDGDGVFSFTTNMDINKPSEYTVIVNSGSYINDPDNPVLSTNHRTIAIKRMLRIPEFRTFTPASEKVFNFPIDSVILSAQLFKSDSGILIKTDSIKATFDGNPIPLRWQNISGGIIEVKVPVFSPTAGRHVIKLYAQDFKLNKAIPLIWTFQVGTVTNQINIVDNEGDDKSSGTVNYPAGVVSGSADISSASVSVNSNLDSLILSVSLKQISDVSRVGVILTNKLDGIYADALQQVELKVPEWHNKGVHFIAAKPGTPGFNPEQENVLFVSRNPLIKTITLTPDAASISNQTFRYSLPLSTLEEILGTFNDTWYLTIYSYLKDGSEALEVTESHGASNDFEDTDVYDVLGISWSKIQERLLANYNSAAQVGGVRIAKIGSENRGAVAIHPDSLNPQLAAVPEIKIFSDGGKWFYDTLRISGIANINAGSQITIRVQDSSISALTNTNKVFSALLRLHEGVNKITAEYMLNGRTIRSHAVYFNYSKSHAPTADIQSTLNGTQLLLNGSNSIDPDGGLLQFTWQQDVTNPQAVTIANPNATSIDFSVPAKKGDYFFQLTVTDNSGLKGWMRTAVQVTDTGVFIPNNSSFHAKWLDTSVVYCVFVRTFDAAGTFNGVKNRLQELKGLGINCIWFLPIHPTTGNLGPDNPGYATTDYMDVLANYGTKEDFKLLVQQAHSLGIKIILDHVIQHTSDLHSFMLDANKYKQYSPYYPFYYWDNNNNFQYLFTWVDLPSLNYENTITRDYLLNVAKYWTQEFNTDGFRCDVAWAINDLRPNGPAYWQSWRSAIKKMKPDAFLLAEADAALPRFFDAKFDAAYDYGWFHTIRSLVSGTSNLNTLDTVLAYFQGANHPKHGIPFKYMENQDEQRFIEAFGPANTKLAAALLFSSPGLPMLYAGQEVGELSFRGIIKWNDPNLLRPYYKKLLATRVRNKALTNGNYRRMQNSRMQEIFTMLRVSDTSNVISNFNFSPDSIGVTINIPVEQLHFDSTKTLYLNDELNSKSYPVSWNQLRNLQIGIPGKSAQILVLGSTPITAIDEDIVGEKPTNFALMQNYPNPFNPSTTIRYDLPHESKVVIEVFNVLGQRVATLVNNIENPGVHSAIFNAERFASGVYIFRLHARSITNGSQYSFSRKMLLLK